MMENGVWVDELFTVCVIKAHLMKFVLVVTSLLDKAVRVFLIYSHKAHFRNIFSNISSETYPLAADVGINNDIAEIEPFLADGLLCFCK